MLRYSRIVVVVGLLVLVVFFLNWNWVSNQKTKPATDSDIAARMISDLAKVEQLDILVFTDGRIAAVKDNFEAGQRITLRGPRFVMGIDHDADSCAANLAGKVSHVIKHNDHPTYEYWAVRLIQQLVGIETPPAETQPTTTQSAASVSAQYAWARMGLNAQYVATHDDHIRP